MPAPLDQAQREQLHCALLELRAQLRELLRDGSGLSDTVQLDQAAVGRISRVDALQAQAMAKASLERVRLRLARVDATLDRYAEDPDEYGICPECDEDIGYPRLAAAPESVLCIQCASRRQSRR